MFTGLIEQVGTIGGWQQTGESRRLTVNHAPWDGDEGGLKIGDSVAVNGACLTAETVAPAHFVCTVLNETVARTSLAEKRVGARVNLERAMAADARFGGHMVQGHVDALGHVREIRRSGGDRVVRIVCQEELMTCIVEKGSIALDGISLTVVGIGDDGFDVHIIPHTWEQTALAGLAPADGINIETDIIGKYVQRCIRAAAADGLSVDKLQSAGGWMGRADR